MRILMLGWEFPPFIAGGLGTACHGLTKALARLGQDILFVLPDPIHDPSAAPHVRMLTPATLTRVRTPFRAASAAARAAAASGVPDAPDVDAPEDEPAEGRTTLRRVPADFSSPYPGFQPGLAPEVEAARFAALQRLLAEADRASDPTEHQRRVLEAFASLGIPVAPAPAQDYGGDMSARAHRYAHLALALAARENFDVIHAHDWMTYPAAIALKHATRRPLVCHIHSTEFDRSGEHVNQAIYDTERAGLHVADCVVAVSQLTKTIVAARYAVPESKIEVVYNGVDDGHQPRPGDHIEARDKIVLFLGRITMQKGPEYFVAAAKRVLEKVPNAKFVVAGSGDMALRMIDLAAEMGIGHRVLFTGFLRGSDVARIFKMADCYVMPSVSEPFGIAALEALAHDVPVIISKTSGVAEVLTHALKVDFWDTDEMANKIVNVLTRPPLQKTLREHAPMELRRLTWDGAATRCIQIYQSLAR